MTRITRIKTQSFVSPDALLKQLFPVDKLFRPMFFINSQFDSMPFHQIVGRDSSFHGDEEASLRNGDASAARADMI